jgi:hypothetical protein
LNIANDRIRLAALLAMAFLGAVLPAPAETDAPTLRQLRPGEIGLTCMLSDGTEQAGIISHSTATHILISDPSARTQRIYINNVIELTLTFDPATTDALSDLPPTEQRMEIGRVLLKRRLEWLALVVFQRAAHDTPGKATEAAFHGRQPQGDGDATTIERIREAYEAARVLLPPAFGGEQRKAGATLADRKYTCPSPALVGANLRRAEAWRDKAATITANVHLIETEHFLIYSAWPKSDDRALFGIYERLYKKLCKQFDIPDEENIWAGKLPVYAFWEKADYMKFAMETCGMSPAMAQGSAGFAGKRGPFSFVVLGPVYEDGGSKQRARKWFFELLTHESTHAFLGRYINDRHVISWVNEGIAETTAATLVPRSQASRKLKHAHRQMKSRDPRSLQDMLRADHIPLDPFFYGCAQSLVRFLIERDREKFIEFVELIKDGKSDEQALKQIYGWDQRQLLALWARALGR